MYSCCEKLIKKNGREEEKEGRREGKKRGEGKRKKWKNRERKLLCLRSNELPEVYGAILERAGQIDKADYKGISSII